MWKIKKIYLHLIILPFVSLPNSVFAKETALGEADNFWELVSLFWSWGLRIILPLSVLTLIVAGFMYMSSGGDENKVSDAKQVWTWSIISATILLFSGVLKTFIQKPLANIEQGGGTLNTLPQVIQNISNLLLTLVWAFAAVVLIYNGIQYMLAAGDQEKIDKAKKQLKYALIGLIIAVSSYYLINLLINFWVN